MTKFLAISVGLLWLALCASWHTHANAVCRVTVNPTACQLSLQAGDSDSVAANAGNAR